MKALVMTVPKSGTRLITSLLDSHPELTCRFNDPATDVGVFHFHNLRREWLLDPTIKKIFLERDLFDGTVSQYAGAGPHGQRNSGMFTEAPAGFRLLLRRRALYSHFMRSCADLVLSYEALTDGGKTITQTRLPGVCALLGVADVMLTTSLAKDPKLLPSNLEVLRRASAIH